MTADDAIPDRKGAGSGPHNPFLSVIEHIAVLQRGGPGCNIDSIRPIIGHRALTVRLITPHQAIPQRIRARRKIEPAAVRHRIPIPGSRDVALHDRIEDDMAAAHSGVTAAAAAVGDRGVGNDRITDEPAIGHDDRTVEGRNSSAVGRSSRCGGLDSICGESAIGKDDIGRVRHECAPAILIQGRIPIGDRDPVNGNIGGAIEIENAV